MNEIPIIYYYSCNFCGKIFQSDKELKIIANVSPLCSNGCKYKRYYSILSDYSEEQIKSLFKILNIEIPKEEKQVLKVLTNSVYRRLEYGRI